MTARDANIAFEGSWERRGAVLVPVLPGDTAPTVRTRQERPARAQHPCQRGYRPTYRTEVCSCGCLIALSERCPKCGSER